MFMVNFFLTGLFFLHGTCSLLLPSRSLLAEASTRSKRAPRNFSSSSLERNRSSVQESTSSTQPSNRPWAGFVSVLVGLECSAHNGVRLSVRRCEGVTRR